MATLIYLDHEMLACGLLARHSFVRPRRGHSFAPTAVQVGYRVERRSRMAAIWRPPEGLVLEGREHGGRLPCGGLKTPKAAGMRPRSHFPSRQPLQMSGMGSGKRHQKVRKRCHQFSRSRSCELDTNTYPKGVTVTDEDMEALNIVRADFHGEWNYTIKPTNRSDRAVDS
jgi:Rhodopirellula transposase DDE domain